MNPDFGKTSSDYAKHRAGFPPSFFLRLKERGIGMAGQRILDLGTGTGTLARGFASQGAHVTGLDISEAQIEAARSLDAAAGLRIDYVVGSAENMHVALRGSAGSRSSPSGLLPSGPPPSEPSPSGLPAGSFEVVVAGQCWHWFNSAVALEEVCRVLASNGHLVICHYDWLPLPGSVAEATESLIKAHNSAWSFGGGDGFHVQWVTDAEVAGYRHVETFSYEHPQPYSHEGWRGRIRASAGVGGSMSPEGVARFDSDHAALLRDRFPIEPLQVLHRVFAVIATRPADSAVFH